MTNNNRNPKSTRQADHRTERAIDTFLNRFFYRKKFRRVESVNDDTRQKEGIDTIADGMLIDNKAMSNPRYVNAPRPTYSLELLVYSSKRRSDYLGWFLNPQLLTTHYLFVWVVEAEVAAEEYITDSRQIRRLEVMLVDRVALHQHIAKQCSDEKLLEYCRKVRRHNQPRLNIQEFGYGAGNPYLRYSDDYEESPCNLIVPKHVLKKFASKHCFVTAKEVTDIS